MSRVQVRLYTGTLWTYTGLSGYLNGNMHSLWSKAAPVFSCSCKALAFPTFEVRVLLYCSCYILRSRYYCTAIQIYLQHNATIY